MSAMANQSLMYLNPLHSIPNTWLWSAALAPWQLSWWGQSLPPCCACCKTITAHINARVGHQGVTNL